MDNLAEGTPDLNQKGLRLFFQLHQDDTVEGTPDLNQKGLRLAILIDEHCDFEGTPDLNQKGLRQERSPLCVNVLPKEPQT